MYRDEVGDEDQRAAKLRADIAELERKLATARGVADTLTLEERRSLQRKLRPVVRWWGIMLVLVSFGIGLLITAALRGLDRKPYDPCKWHEERPIQYVPFKR